MPYVIETTTPPCGAQFRRCQDPEHATVTSYAVATLDEAREAVQDIAAEVTSSHPYALDAEPTWPERDALAIPEHGGTVGPLPDGTVIEVRQVSWDELAKLAKHPMANHALPDPSRVHRAAILDAYNGH